MPDLPAILTTFNLGLGVKIILCALIGIYTIFTLTVFNQIRSLDKVITINEGHASKIVLWLSFLYVLVSASLFLVALVIL